MTRPSVEVIRKAKAARAQLADQDTPFIYNEWYVAAYANEVGRTLLARTLLNKRIVLFRQEDGTPVALDDRCAHRSYPLSASLLDGDTIVCGYHGFRYDSKGDCIAVPSAARCPRTIGVKNYALVEKGDLVWIWMGDAEDADPATLCDQQWLISQAWTRSKGYYHLPANYITMHENLLDLTHLSYLHANSFGTPDYASAPFQTKFSENEFMIRRDVVPTLLPPVWGVPTGLSGVATAARVATSTFKSPGFHEVQVSFYDSALPVKDRPVSTIRTAHLPTPETHSSMHYFIVHGRDFALEDDGVTQFMHEQLFAAFKEDVDGMALVEQALATAHEDDFYEISVASDAPAIAMRRYVKGRADAEHAGR
jgi:phenylpropionate dioxygenase-like ring-hydroxylating dioxygenase large terminal subunit